MKYLIFKYDNLIKEAELLKFGKREIINENELVSVIENIDVIDDINFSSCNIVSLPKFEMVTINEYIDIIDCLRIDNLLFILPYLREYNFIILKMEHGLDSVIDICESIDTDIFISVAVKLKELKSEYRNQIITDLVRNN